MQDLERKQLIPSLFIKAEQPLLCYVPLVYSGILLFFTTASVVIDSFSSSLSSLSSLPESDPKLFQVGVLLSALPGFMIIWAFHLFIWSKLREQKNSVMWVGFSFFLGILTQTSLILFVLAPSEEWFMPTNLIAIQENAFLTAFMGFSVIYECLSVSLTLSARSKQVINHQDLWVSTKIAFLITIFIFSSVQVSLLSYSKMYSVRSLLKNLLKVLNYVVFFMHVLYTGSFYWDLQQITFTINFGYDEIEDKALNSSTF